MIARVYALTYNALAKLKTAYNGLCQKTVVLKKKIDYQEITMSTKTPFVT